MREGFQIGPLMVHYYGILIMLGVLAAAYVASREAKRMGQNSELIWDMLPWLLIGGIVGARLWHILTPPASMVEQGITVQYYLTHPLDALAIWKGGLGIPGAVIGGALALVIYARQKKLSFLAWADMIAPGLILAQAVGRWGNFVNQELYGAPSNLPWAIFIDAAHRLPGYEEQAYYHPLFLYESLWNLLVMGFLLWFARRFKDWIRTGDVFLVYLMLYPIGRFSLDFLRLDPSYVGGLNVNQTIMAVIALVALALLLWKHRNPASPQVDTSAPDLDKETPDA